MPATWGAMLKLVILQSLEGPVVGHVILQIRSDWTVRQCFVPSAHLATMQLKIFTVTGWITDASRGSRAAAHRNQSPARLQYVSESTPQSRHRHVCARPNREMGAYSMALSMAVFDQ